MTGRGGIWDARLAITELDVPVVYFVEERQKGRTNVSAMRACHPQAAGLEMPSRMFWPFIEGFEEGLESWQLHRAPKGAEIKEGAPAFHGRCSRSKPVCRLEARPWWWPQRGFAAGN